MISPRYGRTPHNSISSEITPTTQSYKELLKFEINTLSVFFVSFIAIIGCFFIIGFCKNNEIKMSMAQIINSIISGYLGFLSQKK